MPAARKLRFSVINPYAGEASVVIGALRSTRLTVSLIPNQTLSRAFLSWSIRLKSASAMMHSCLLVFAGAVS